MKLTRLTDSPILNPIEKNNWEKAAVFNAAAVYHNEKFHMIYRSPDIGGDKK